MEDKSKPSFHLPDFRLPPTPSLTVGLLPLAESSVKIRVMVETTAGSPVLLYDGVCGFCNKTVQMILDRDRRGTMRFAALQSDYGQATIERHPELRGVDSVVFVERAAEGERVYARSDAALRVAAY